MKKNQSITQIDPGDTNALVGWVHDFVRQVRLAWRLFFDARVPWWTKIVPPVALAYVLFPVDIIPDLLPAAGQLDDLAVLLLGMKLFIELAPPEIAREHLQALGARIRDWRVVEGEEGAPADQSLLDRQHVEYEIEIQPDEIDEKEPGQPPRPPKDLPLE